MKINGHEITLDDLKSLTYKEREVIKLRHGLSDGFTYTRREVGEIFKVTIGRIRSLEGKAIAKLEEKFPTKESNGCTT